MEFLSVGKIIKPHGLKGEVFVRLVTPERDFVSQLKVVEIQKGSHRIQWNVKKARPHKDGMLLQPEELTRIEEAEEFRGFKVRIPKSFFESQAGENFFLSEVEGFSVIDETGRLRGEITGFEQNGDQDLAIIKSGQGTFLMPFMDAMTIEKDWEGRSITMRIPEGLEGLNS